MFNYKGESWKTQGAAFHDGAFPLGPCPWAQYMVLTTCNRNEVFYWERGLTEESALAYLFRIAAGLESMVLGEYQILGQFKAAYAAAQREGHVGKELDRILRDAITCAKKVKTELDLGAVPPSVCRAGMDELESCGGCRGKRVFVIGSGRTGSLAAELASERGAAAIAVCNRSPERAAKLAEHLGAKIVPYEARYETVAASDVVISATASPHTVVEASRLHLAHPTLFLDLASPRDVDPAIAENPLATVLSLATIGERAAGDRDERADLLARGEAIVNEAVRKTEAWLNAL